MKTKNKRIVALSVCMLGIALSCNAQLNAFKDFCAEKSKTSGIAVKGMEEWQFLKSELRHLSAGNFWNQESASTPQKNPLPAIINYNASLAKENIKLVLVPIPPKAIIYPDKLDKKFVPKRHDVLLEQFYSILAQKGIDVLDLTIPLLKARKGNEPLYCLGDSHLSGEGCRVVAQHIAKKIGLHGKGKYTCKEEHVEFTGDLYKSTGHSPEKRKVYTVSGKKLKDTASPIVLMGDSHTLVFDIGDDMFFQNAGIASHLSAELGMPIDVIGVRGSGATPARINFFRKSKSDKNYLKEKKVVVWCFAAREFTEATAWNPNVPVK